MDLLKRFNYPDEGLLEISPDGGPDTYFQPQERYSARVCAWCRRFNGYDCTKGREVNDPDEDTCDDIDYIEEWLEDLRDPVRQEYSSEKTYQQACKAIRKLKRWQEAEDEHQWNIQHYGKYYWKEEE